jgi:hypothetical protein
MRITPAARKEVTKAFAADSPAIVVGKAELGPHYPALYDRKRKMRHSVTLFGGIQGSLRRKAWYIHRVHRQSPKFYRRTFNQARGLAIATRCQY